MTSFQTHLRKIFLMKICIENVEIRIHSNKSLDTKPHSEYFIAFTLFLHVSVRCDSTSTLFKKEKLQTLMCLETLQIMPINTITLITAYLLSKRFILKIE